MGTRDPKRNLVLATFFEMRDVYNGDAAYGRTYFQYLGTTPGLAPASDGPTSMARWKRWTAMCALGGKGC